MVETRGYVGSVALLLLRNFAHDFIQLFGPHLNRRLVDRALEARDTDAQAELFRKISLPVR